MNFSLNLSQTKTCVVPKSILHSDPTRHTLSTRSVSGWLWPPTLCFTRGNLSRRKFETAFLKYCLHSKQLIWKKHSQPSESIKPQTWHQSVSAWRRVSEVQSSSWPDAFRNIFMNEWSGKSLSPIQSVSSTSAEFSTTLLHRRRRPAEGLQLQTWKLTHRTPSFKQALHGSVLNA